MYSTVKVWYRNLPKKLLCLFAIICLLVSIMPHETSTAYAASYSTPTGYYLLKNVESGKYLNVVGNSSSSKANVTVFRKDGTSGQLFKLQTSNSGWTVLIPACATSCRLNVSGNTSTNGANVNIYKDTGHSTQGWYFEKVNGGYVVRSANKTSIVLSEAGTKNSSNVRIATYSKGSKSQIWVLESFTPTLTLSSGKASIPVGDDYSVTITTKPTFSSVSVSSKDDSIATCIPGRSITDKNGKAILKISGKKKGSTSITVIANGIKELFDITVVSASVPNTASFITTDKINKALKQYGLDVSSVGLGNLTYSNSKYYWKYIKYDKKNPYKINSFSSLEEAKKATEYSYYGFQCFGFANLLGHQITGKVPTEKWKKYSSDKSLNSAGGLKVGDIVRFEVNSTNGHTAMVYKISNGKITWVECLGGSGNRVDITGFNGNSSGTGKSKEDYRFMNSLNNWKNDGLVYRTKVGNKKFGYVLRYIGSK